MIISNGKFKNEKGKTLNSITAVLKSHPVYGTNENYSTKSIIQDLIIYEVGRGDLLKYLQSNPELQDLIPGIDHLREMATKIIDSWKLAYEQLK